LLNGEDHLSVSVISEPGMAEGQVRLRLEDQEQEIDTKAVLSAISDAIEAYYFDTLNNMKDSA